jgi:hypothetical protein
MKSRSVLACIGTLLAIVPISASAFTTSFTSYTPGTEIAGSNGWSINNAGADSSTFFSLSYGAWMPYKGNAGDLRRAAELGGWQDSPLADPNPVILSQSQEVAGELKNVSFSVDFSVRTNTGDFAGTPRDAFGFSLLGAASANLVTILLNPEDGGSGDAYRIGYTVGSGAFVPAEDANHDPLYAHASSYYTMALNFLTGGTDPTFSVLITSLGSGQGTMTFGGTATGLGSATMDTFAAVWNVNGGGDNGMTFDEITVVPEPSTALLAGLASLGLLRRRRH